MRHHGEQHIQKLAVPTLRYSDVAVSSPELVENAREKLETARFLARHDIPSPATAAAEDVRDNPDAWDWPLIVKARGGSASRGLRLVNGPSDLPDLTPSEPLVAQQRLPGHEYTVNELRSRACRGRVFTDV